MELEFFCEADQSPKWFSFWVQERLKWWRKYANEPEGVRVCVGRWKGGCDIVVVGVLYTVAQSSCRHYFVRTVNEAFPVGTASVTATAQNTRALDPPSPRFLSAH